jgi:hypothetical protein
MLDGGWTAGGGAGGGGGDAIGVAVAVVVAVVVVVVLVVVVLVVVVAVHVGGVHRRPLHRVARPRALHLDFHFACANWSCPCLSAGCQKHNLSLMIRARSERQKHNQGYDLACQTTRPRGGLAPV